MANTDDRAIPKVLELAGHIDAHIRKQRLKPGASYLTTAEAARLFRVGTSTANRALQVLVKRGRLVRRQRVGTVVAEASSAGSTGPGLGRIHLIVPLQATREEGALNDGTLVGLQGVFPGSEVLFRFMGAADDGEDIATLIDTALKSPVGEGFILLRSSLTTQRLVAASGLPAVVYGSLYPGIAGLATVERDLTQVAALAVNHLIQRGARHLAVFARQVALPGDHAVADATLQALARHGHGCDRLTLRALPGDREVIQHAARAVLRLHGGEVGFLCRSEAMAEGVALACREARRAARIVVTDTYLRHGERRLAWDHLATDDSPEQIGAVLGACLADAAASRGTHRVLPVHLVEG